METQLSRHRQWSLFAAIGITLLGTACAGGASREAQDQDPEAVRTQQARDRLYAALQPVRLTNCTMERFGEPNDGGYLMCGNLLGQVESAYSYGIAGYDQWGCDTSQRLGVRVHQYDCFDLTQPACPDGDTVFHPECIASSTFTDAEGRPFDTLEHQLARNGDRNRNIVLKMDVEGAEWDAIMRTPDDVFERIDQLAIELHGIDGDIESRTEVVEKLKRHFHLVHLHFNNFACTEGHDPFPAWAYELLFVSKRLGIVDPAGGEVKRPHSLDERTDPEEPDCQYVRRTPR